jgi:lipid-binding SYLF domain-containing protein
MIGKSFRSLASPGCPTNKGDRAVNDTLLRCWWMLALGGGGVAVGVGLLAPPAAAQDTPDIPAGATVSSKPDAIAMAQVDDAATVAGRMLCEPRVRELLQPAKGIFIVPAYGRAALGLGASVGAGLLVIRRADGAWSDPAFYNIGSLSAGAQIGAESGAIALVLMNERAVNKFMQKNSFALSAAAGLTIVNWSKLAQGAIGDGDVVAWAGTSGLYGSVVALGVSDIRYNRRLTDAYYHRSVLVADVLAGKYPNPQADTLKHALAGVGASAPAAAPTPP